MFCLAAETDSKLWVIDRQSYQSVLVQSALRRLSHTVELISRWASDCPFDTQQVQGSAVYIRPSPRRDTSRLPTAFQCVVLGWPSLFFLPPDLEGGALKTQSLHLCVCSVPFLQPLPEDVIMKMSDLVEEVRMKNTKKKKLNAQSIALWGRPS